MPKFSIILPVRNGGAYLKDCVSSILNQTYSEFNLIILENNSTDGTQEWLKEQTDPRISIYPADRSLTIEENWGRIRSTRRNEYMTMIGHDDLLAPEYLEVMDRLITRHPDASLYQAHFSYIDSEGKLIRYAQAMAEIDSAASFLASFLDKKIDVMGTGFMMRSVDYDRIGGIQPYPNLLFADFELWIRLTMLDYKATASENCFSFRLHQSTTTVSPDTKFQQAFSKFIHFLAYLRKTDAAFDSIIREKSGKFLLFYCQGLSHRLLRTPSSARNGLSVKAFVSACRDYAAILGINSQFRLNFSTILALVLDSNAITRALFLGVKKIYSRPVLK